MNAADLASDFDTAATRNRPPPQAAAPGIWGDEPVVDAADPVSDMTAELAEYADEDDEPPPPPDEYDLWTQRLGMFRTNGLWMPAWGPRPGQEGCEAPHELLQEGRR